MLDSLNSTVPLLKLPELAFANFVSSKFLTWQPTCGIAIEDENSLFCVT